MQPFLGWNTQVGRGGKRSRYKDVGGGGGGNKVKGWSSQPTCITPGKIRNLDGGEKKNSS